MPAETLKSTQLCSISAIVVGFVISFLVFSQRSRTTPLFLALSQRVIEGVPPRHPRQALWQQGRNGFPTRGG